MSDRPDLDEAAKTLQAGGFKITGGKYAPVDPETGIKPTLKTQPNPKDPQAELVTSISFTTKGLEQMLRNAKAGGSVEVILTIKKELVIR